MAKHWDSFLSYCIEYSSTNQVLLFKYIIWCHKTQAEHFNMPKCQVLEFG